MIVDGKNSTVLVRCNILQADGDHWDGLNIVYRKARYVSVD